MSELTKSQHGLLVDRSDVREAWIAQLEKDLQIELTGKVESTVSFGELAMHIEEVLSQKFGLSEADLPELLYRIDLNENQLRLEMREGKFQRWFELLSHAILIREAQKVIFRFQYAGKL